MKRKVNILMLLLLVLSGRSAAQTSIHRFRNSMQKIKKDPDFISKANQVYQYGIADAFVNGVYEGDLTMEKIKTKGNFGLGAPNLIDGELTVLDGIIYQTRANGKTIEAPQDLRSPFTFVTFFQPERSGKLSDVKCLTDLYAKIGRSLPHLNALYAIRINGVFSHVKTRAFPALRSKPFLPLAELLDKQHFFNYDQVRGSMVGFFMPAYLSGVNIAGLHFHFLSDDRKSGGHIVEMSAKELTIEIAELSNFTLQPLNTSAFHAFVFKQDNSRDLQQVEKGQK